MLLLTLSLISALTSIILSNPLWAALTTFDGFVLLQILVTIFFTPKTSATALSEAPALIPVPSGAGLRRTTLPQYLVFTS